MKKLLICLTILFGISLFISFTPAFAYTFGSGDFKIELNPDTPYGESDKGVSTTVESIFSAVITVSEIIFVVLFLIAGVLYMTGLGNEEQVGKARKMMIEAVIGIVIVFAAWTIGTWILDRLKGASSSGGGTSQSGTNTTPSANNTPTSTVSVEASESNTLPAVKDTSKQKNPLGDE